jgi:hypothetical protein
LWDYWTNTTNTPPAEQTGSGEFTWSADYKYIRLVSANPCADCHQHPCSCITEPQTDCCIDYSHTDIIVPGRIGGDDAPEFFINLTKETITVPAGFSVTQFRTDNQKMKNVKQALSDLRFPRLLNKDMTLQITDGTTTVTFPAINGRAQQQKLAVNFAIAADPTGATPGQWVLVARDDAKKTDAKAVRNNIEIGIAAVNPANGKPLKVTDDNGFGRFFDHCGICVKPLPPAVGTAKPKPARTAYFIRTAPRPPAQDGGAYTAGSRARRINVMGQQRMPNFSIKIRDAKGSNPATATINLRAGTYIWHEGITSGKPALRSAKASEDVINVTSKIELWMAATPRRPASAKQELTR